MSPPTLQTDTKPPPIHRSRAVDWPQIGAVLLVFFAYSAVCRPIPSVNEPHYLTKARHEWQPAWCDGDFFLESSSPHLVFYRTIGALTQWLTLPHAAWTGRVIALALLAWGWTRLVSRLSPQRWTPVGSACWFLLFQALGHFSGEWVVGGVESKVLAYALAFAGWASLLDGRTITAGLSLGLAMSFHPVVGGWCVIAAALAVGWEVWTGRLAEELPVLPTVRQWLIGLLTLCAAAMPGVIPAIQSLVADDPQAAALADRYQVGIRLAHHLDPLTFPLVSYAYYGLLLFLWLILRRYVPASPGGRLFEKIVQASVVIAAVGLLIAAGPRPIQEMPLAGLRIWLLKFYPFRLADLLVPLLVAVLVFAATTQWCPRGDRGWRRWVSGLLAAAALGLALWMPNPDKNSSRMNDSKRADWQAACEWIRTQTPPDALVYAADEHWAVKWFCHRAEYVNYKDCPQDAAGILEWVRRLKTVNRWESDTLSDGHISPDELRQLHDETGITHLLVSRFGPIDSDAGYANESFHVYAIGP